MITKAEQLAGRSIDRRVVAAGAYSHDGFDMALQRLKRGDFVTYRAITMTFSAIVRHVHRDGSITVEARHELRNGTPTGCYIGELVRLEAREVWADLGGSARLPAIGKMTRFHPTTKRHTS